MKKKSLVTGLVTLTVMAPLLVSGARAQGFRDRIRNLWGQNSSHRSIARDARQRASQTKSSAAGTHDQLSKTAQVFLQANSAFLNVRQQVKRTEANIIRTRHRIQIVQKRYDVHKQLFGARLASMQRHGQIGYLNIVLGSRTLSELSRRAYLYQAIASRDAGLQNDIKADRDELQTAQNGLMSQWQQRNRLQQAAMRERRRVILAQQTQLARWKNLQREVYTDLAFSDVHSASAKRARARIYSLEAERSRIEDEYENQRSRYSSAPRRSYRRRYRTRRPRYRTIRVTRSVRTQTYVPVGGVLKPMSIEKLQTREVKIPQADKGSVLSEDYVVEDAPN